jgi:hypothetical protein
MNVNLRASARQATHAASQAGKAIPERPCDGVRCIVAGCFLYGNPALRDARNINLQDLGQLIPRRSEFY